MKSSGVPRLIGIWFVVLFLLAVTGCIQDKWTIVPGQVGWVIGFSMEGNAAILNTSDGGLTWVEQGDPSLLAGGYGNDISAVDEQTAWAALGNFSGAGGAILHTKDGGGTWSAQALPPGVNEEVKGIKGLSPQLAWAATIGGTIMRTMDGGQTWVVVPHPGVTIHQVNRIDAKGSDIWIADSLGPGVIHSPDFGATWRLETLPGMDLKGQGGPMGISIVSHSVAWAAVKTYTDLYQTTDGGLPWRIAAPEVSSENDIDDICAPNADTVWSAQNVDSNAGFVIQTQLVNGQAISNLTDPMNRTYTYEGVSCFDENNVWVVGMRGMSAATILPSGVILHTVDGGKTWTNQTLLSKDSDVALWKVSFVGAHR
jgi:photosystem II stability/assembly factor-like uncharacterized protein